MPEYTDHETVTYHEDGSYTTESVITHYPLTKAQKATAWGALGLIAVAPVVPLLVLVAVDKFEEKMYDRRLAKAAKAEAKKK